MEIAAGQAPAHLISEARVFTGGFSAWAQEPWTRSGSHSSLSLPACPSPSGARAAPQRDRLTAFELRKRRRAEAVAQRRSHFPACVQAQSLFRGRRSPLPSLVPGSCLPRPARSQRTQTRASQSRRLVVLLSLAEGQQLPAVYKKLYQQTAEQNSRFFSFPPPSFPLLSPQTPVLPRARRAAVGEGAQTLTPTAASSLSPSLGWESEGQTATGRRRAALRT